MFHIRPEDIPMVQDTVTSVISILSNGAELVTIPVYSSDDFPPIVITGRWREKTDIMQIEIELR